MKKVIVCIDIGGSSMKTGVCDLKGKLEGQEILPVGQHFSSLMETVEVCLEKARMFGDVIGIAVSAPGAVDAETGVIGGMSAVPCIHGPSWTEELEKRFSLPASIENDANCAAMAEVVFGNGKGCRDLAFVVCGTGIGGAVVVDGKICRGKHLYGGEFGCMVMRDEEGAFSTFSLQASTMSLVRRVKKVCPDREWDGRKIFDEAERGNAVCAEAIDQFYSRLAEGIYNIQHVYDPERILLGGGISSREDFAEQIIKRLKQIVKMTEETAGTKVVLPDVQVCSYRKDANLVGAAAVFMQKYPETAGR